MTDILIKFPTRQRKKKFFDTLDAYYNLLSGKHKVKFIISMDLDDQEMNSTQIRSRLDEKKGLKYFYGEHKTKMEAINDDMQHAGEFKIIFLASDDMIPQIPGYDHVIMKNMKENFPDFFGALHYNDGRVGERINTLVIMGKPMYDYFGYIYHPDYKSLWCDNEFTEVIRQMKKIKYINKVLVKHAWGGRHGDSLYERNENLYSHDKHIFEQRKSMGFPIESIL